MTESQITLAPELNALDRCDRCSSQAFVVADFVNGRLLFCWHHARKLRSQLESQALKTYNFEQDPML